MSEALEARLAQAERQIALAGKSSLSTTLRLIALQAAVDALIATHPAIEEALEKYEQLAQRQRDLTVQREVTEEARDELDQALEVMRKHFEFPFGRRDS